MAVHSATHSDMPALQVHKCLLIFYILELIHTYLRMVPRGKSMIFFLRRMTFLDCIPHHLPEWSSLTCPLPITEIHSILTALTVEPQASELSLGSELPSVHPIPLRFPSASLYPSCISTSPHGGKKNTKGTPGWS